MADPGVPSSSIRVVGARQHNLDVIAAADCVIDLGLEGGAEGGRVVGWGAPEEVAQA